MIWNIFVDMVITFIGLEDMLKELVNTGNIQSDNYSRICTVKPVVLKF